LLSAASAPQDDLQKPRILTILLALENVTLVAKWRSFLSAIWHSFGDLGFGKRLVGRPRRPPFAANAVRLQLHALAYNLGNFLRTLATPEPIKDWSLTSLKEKLIKICAKVVSHGRYVAFQMAEVAIPKNLFADILRMIAELRPPPDPTPA
jgi:hypothetical protein